MESNGRESSDRTSLSAWTDQQGAHHTIYLSEYGRGGKYSDLSGSHYIDTSLTSDCRPSRIDSSERSNSHTVEAWTVQEMTDHRSSRDSWL